MVLQVCHQAAGGRGVLRGRRPELRTAGSPRAHEQTQQGAAEAHEGAEHPETGMSGQGTRPGTRAGTKPGTRPGTKPGTRPRPR